MGFCIEMSGEGCRYYESLQGENFRWKCFFQKFYREIRKGCAEIELFVLSFHVSMDDSPNACIMLPNPLFNA